MKKMQRKIKKYVRGQVDRILDEEYDEYLSVIVQMENPDEDLDPILEASTEALRSRNLTISARELIPPPADLILKKSKLSSSDVRKLRETGDTMTSQVTLAAIETIGKGVLRLAGLDVVAELMRSELVQNAMQNAIESMGKKIKNKKKTEGFNKFWSSQSAVLKLHRDELNKLTESVSNVGAVFLNRIVKIPPIMRVTKASQQGLENRTSAWGIEKIGALAAWGAYGTRGKPNDNNNPVKVAVLDTGVDPIHPELLNKVVDWAEFDEDGYQVEGSTPHDSDKHGTHVCGTIAGGRDESPSKDYPFIGVAPDAELAVGLVLKGGSGRYSQILAGLDWAIESGAEVINMSLGGTSFEPDVVDAYTRAILKANRLGIPVVVSIGNDGSQTSGPPGNDYFAFSIGATDSDDHAAGFSGGRTQVIRNSRYISEDYLPLVYSKPEVSAPGVAIRSCIPGDKYDTWNGTSMAAPNVSGILALLLASTNIRSVPAQRRGYLLQDLIISSVDELGESGKDHRYGFGRVNILRAIEFAKAQGY